MEESQLQTPECWIGVRTRGRQRFWSEISQTLINDEGKSIYEHEFLGYYPTPFAAAVVRDARAIEMFGQDADLNFPDVPVERIKQLAHQAKENEVRANQRMTLGTGTDTQTLNDLVETFQEESNSDVPLLERVMVDVPIPADIRRQENYSGTGNRYRYFIWETDGEYFLDKYEQDSENVWIRRWSDPLVFSTHMEAFEHMEREMVKDNDEECGDE